MKPHFGKQLTESPRSGMRGAPVKKRGRMARLGHG